MDQSSKKQAEPHEWLSPADKNQSSIPACSMLFLLIIAAILRCTMVMSLLDSLKEYQR